MVTRLPTPCSHRGCPELVRETNGGYCPRHQRQRWRSEKRDALERTPDEQAFYKSRAWRKARLGQLTSEPLCRNCGRLAQMVDHVVPLRNGGPHFDPSNLQSLCHSCHNVKRGREAHGVNSG